MEHSPVISTKWDKGRLVVMGGSPGTSFTIRNAVGAAKRTGCGLAVACVPDKIVSVLDRDFKITGFGDYEQLDKNGVLGLINKSDAVCFGMGIEAQQSTIKGIVSMLLSGVIKPIILDADGVKCIQHETEALRARKSEKQTTVLTLNMQETEHVFGSHYPENNLMSRFAVENGAYILLKGPCSKLFTPQGKLHEIKTNDCPEMANAGSGDVLTGLIGGFMAQKIDTTQSILAAVHLRRAAAKHYLKKTGDIVAQPEDVISHMRFVVGELHPSNKKYS